MTYTYRLVISMTSGDMPLTTFYSEGVNDCLTAGYVYCFVI